MKPRLFYCYSKRLKLFIESYGIHFESLGIHPKSKRPFYLYIVTDELDSILKEWGGFKNII